jgi:hypothetical protein
VSKVNCFWSSLVMFAPADQENGMTVCQDPAPPGCRLIPYFAPAFSFIAFAIAFRPSQSVGGVLKPAFAARSLR